MISCSAASSQGRGARASSREEWAAALASCRAWRAFLRRTRVSPAKRGLGGHSPRRAVPLRAPASLAEAIWMPLMISRIGCSDEVALVVQPAVLAS